MPVLFRRLYEKFDQIDATIDRNTRAFERNERAFERNERAFDRHDQAFRDFQEAFRQDRLRSEKLFQETLTAIGEMRADIRANTEATWRMLYRWGEGPSPAS